MVHSHLYPLGGYSQKNWVGLCSPLPKIVNLIMAKICDFPALFMTKKKIQHPIYDLAFNPIPCFGLAFSYN